MKARNLLSTVSEFWVIPGCERWLGSDDVRNAAAAVAVGFRLRVALMQCAMFAGFPYDAGSFGCVEGCPRKSLDSVVALQEHSSAARAAVSKASAVEMQQLFGLRSLWI